MMLRRTRRFLQSFGVFLVLLPAAALAQDTAPPARALVVDGGTLIDVSGSGASTADIKDAVVVISGGQIVAAGPRSAVKIPAGAEIVHAAGKYVVPGLNDAYSSQNNQAQANAHLYMGVTAIVAGDEPPEGRRGPLDTKANPSPRIYQMEVLTGYHEEKLTPPPATIGELMDRGTPLSEPELIQQIDSLAKRGIKVLLLYYSLSPEQVRVAARHARELGLATIGELGKTTYREAIEAGVRAFVHTARYSLDTVPPELRAEVARVPFGSQKKYYPALLSLTPNDPALQRQAVVFGSGKAGLIPTASHRYLDLPGHGNPWKEPIAAMLDPKDIHLPADRTTGERTQPGFSPGVAQKLLEIDEQYRKAGARFLTGSGSDAFGTMPGISLHTELEMLVRIGLTPRQALAAATSNFGELFGWSTVGQVKAGYNADLLVLDENPVQDVSHLKKIHLVILNGKILDRDGFLKPAETPGAARH